MTVVATPIQSQLFFFATQIDHLEKSEKTRSEEEEKKEQAVNPLVLRKLSTPLCAFKGQMSVAENGGRAQVSTLTPNFPPLPLNVLKHHHMRTSLHVSLSSPVSH